MAKTKYDFSLITGSKTDGGINPQRTLVGSKKMEFKKINKYMNMIKENRSEGNSGDEKTPVMKAF